MTRVPQPAGKRGSLKWIQRATNERWPELDGPILAKLPLASTVEWRSPLQSDDFAEYRDGAFLDRLGRGDLTVALNDFWPRRGPQWDALGRTDRGDLLLVEAKAHVPELCSPGTAASESSRARIKDRLDEVAARLGARPARAPWSESFYQLANRIAHLSFLREGRAPAYLVLVNFLNDSEMNGPTSQEAWEAAYEVAFHVMGLPKRHALTPFIIEVFPDVSRKAH
jgi:hypothetical protein